MTRLTKNYRQEILDRAVEKSDIPKREKALIKKRAEWAEAVRLKAVGGKETDRKLKAARTRLRNLLEKLPEDCVRSYATSIRADYAISLNVAGRWVRAFFNGAPRFEHPADPVTKISPSEFTLEAKDPLTAAFERLDQEQVELRHARVKLRADIWALLSSVNTTRQLLDVWPEAEKFLPKTQAAQKTGLPAVQIRELNKQLGLGTKKACR